MKNVRYNGFNDAESCITTYYAIPYAYASRFKPSRSIDDKPGISSGDVINASTHGAACINFNLPPPYNKGFEFLLGTTPIEPQSEDCLNFDVYVPDGGHKDLPVLFFTPGGGFLVGASFVYDMKALVGRGVAMGMPFIGVSINYRLGPLGFLNPSTCKVFLGITATFGQSLLFPKSVASINTLANTVPNDFRGRRNQSWIAGSSGGSEIC